MNNNNLTGCIHIRVEKGKIKNVFTHVDNLPEEGVIHVDFDKDSIDVWDNDRFLVDHQRDSNELTCKDSNKVFNLKDESL